MRNYSRISWYERLKIEVLYNAGHSYAFIASQLNRSTSSIYLEIKHGFYGHMGAETSRRPCRYSAVRAQDYARYQATAKGSPLKMGFNFCFAYDVRDMIFSGRSIEHIVNYKKSHGQFTVSVSTLYRYVDRGFIPDVTNRDLPCRGTHKRKKASVRLSRLPHGALITDRPFLPDDRSEFGHWEMDSVIGKAKGKRESLLVLTERKTRFELILRTAGKTSAATVRALDSALSKLPKEVFKSITVDNGCEFQDCYG